MKGWVKLYTLHLFTHSHCTICLLTQSLPTQFIHSQPLLHTSFIPPTHSHSPPGGHLPSPPSTLSSLVFLFDIFIQLTIYIPRVCVCVCVYVCLCVCVCVSVCVLFVFECDGVHQSTLFLSAIFLSGKIYLFMLYAKLHTIYLGLGLHMHYLNWTLVQRLLFNGPLGLNISPENYNTFIMHIF